MECLKNLESISPNPNPLRSGKRSHSESDTDSSIALSNKFFILQNEININDTNSILKHDNVSPQDVNTKSTITAEKRKKFILSLWNLVK